MTNDSHYQGTRDSKYDPGYLVSLVLYLFVDDNSVS